MKLNCTEPNGLALVNKTHYMANNSEVFVNLSSKRDLTLLIEKIINLLCAV